MLITVNHYLASLETKFDTFVDSANSDVTVFDIKTKLNELHSDVIELSSRPPVESNLNTESILKSIDEQIKVLSTQQESIAMGISRSDQTLSDQETDIEVPTVNIDQPTPRPAPFDPYMSYKESAIDESMKSRLLQFVEELSENGKFEEVSDSREVFYTGEYGYFYTGKYHPPCTTPIEIQDLLDVVRPNLSNQKAWINSCLITRYVDGNANIPFHRDDELFINPNSEILTVSIGAKRTIEFVDNADQDKKEPRTRGLQCLRDVSPFPELLETWNSANT